MVEKTERKYNTVILISKIKMALKILRLHSKKKINTFCHEILISSRTAGSGLQKRSLLHKTKKN
jgi:hypothetical protein